VIGPPTYPWAKLGPALASGERSWHPLPDHCADVAAVFEALLECDVIESRLARSGKRSQLSIAQRQRLCALAAFHDIGKFNRGFQNKAVEGARPVAGHVTEILSMFGGYWCHEVDRLVQALAADGTYGWVEEDKIQEFLIAAIAHHGRPQPVGVGFRRELWIADSRGDPFDGIARLRELVSTWFPEAYESDGEPLPAAPAFQHTFNGLLTLADWLASDSALFPFTEPGDGERFAESRVRARRALGAIGIDTTAARRSLAGGSAGFGRISEYAPRPAQLRLSTATGCPGGSVTILEDETGSGKTEAALARFLALFEAGEVDGLYFALPTRTSATQMHARVVKAIARAFPGPADRPPVSLAVPGYLKVDEQPGRRLAGFEVLWNDDEKERWRYRGWAAEHAKRYLAGAVVVGTVDQVLLSALMVPHAHLRAASLLRHLLVVDEVHASDAYMTRILEHVLSRHREGGGHALLMSATLGAVARNRLLTGGPTTSAGSIDEACAVPYPVVTESLGGAALQMHGLPYAGQPRVVRVRIDSFAADPKQIADAALKAARRGARVLVIRNTVRECVATQVSMVQQAAAMGGSALLFVCAGAPAPHHSRYSTEDREALDNALEAAFGRDAPPTACVAVATQTVQQSLDIDADLMITDLCPMDVLLQRIGRLHRNQGRLRARGFEVPTVIVCVPTNRQLGDVIRKDGTARGPLGLGTVYPDLRVIEATWRLLESQPELLIPEMNRELVERATHPDALRSIVCELQGPWPAHEREAIGTAVAHRRLGTLNVIDWSMPFGHQGSLFPSGTLDREIPTRLGEGDRSAEFASAVQGPFGHAFHRLTIPAHLCRGADADASPFDVESVSGGVDFTFGARRFT
jgi:CRISPR-associated endonuclease/helicase Cas3